MALSVAKIV